MKAEDRYDSLIRYYAEVHGFTGKDWLKFKAQIAAESNFNPKARSGVGAKGLAQFMPATWTEQGHGEEITNPEANIAAQVRYMAWLLRRMTTWDAGFAAYNWGIGNMLRVLGKPEAVNWKQTIPLETKEYIFKINQTYDLYARGA